ncbi:MAG: hypothetical protein GY754_17920, partial [bacterium]|nr:hypothetical protein [bacterium]
MDIEEIKKQLLKKAIQLQIGGFRPPEDISTSWFGKVNLCAKDESWPHYQGLP